MKLKSKVKCVIIPINKYIKSLDKNKRENES